MTWWCSTTRDAWTWAFKAYPGIWLAMTLLIGSYVIVAIRHHRSVGIVKHDKRKFLWFGLGAASLWIATDWPLGSLGASYLALAHMIQYQIYTLAAAPLILLGTPEWMARPIVERLRLTRAVRWISRPLIAGVGFNIILLATHAPFTVDTFRVNQFGSMVLDLLWLLSGFMLWFPLISPLPELRNPSPAVKCVYLFLAAGAIPMGPGGFLTFAEFPLYRIYELAPRVDGFSAESDQQLAGILMKIGNIPIVWGVIFAIFVKWAMLDRDTARGFGGHLPDDASEIIDGDPGDQAADGPAPQPELRPATFASHRGTANDRSAP